MNGRMRLVATLLGTGIMLAGCSAATPEPTPTPTAIAEVESTVPELTSLADLADTRWLVDDSDGDRTSTGFNADGTVSYTSGTQSFAYPEDTWTVSGDTVTWQVTFGARYGIWTLVGTFDPETQLITGTWTSTVNESGTFEAKQPVR